MVDGVARPYAAVVQVQMGPSVSMPVGRMILGRVAAVDLSGHRVVAPRPDGTVEYASNDDLADASRPLWLTLGAALEGDAVTVATYGEVTEPSWNWTTGPIFLGADGHLTQTPPAAPAVFSLVVAAASAQPDSIFFDPRTPIAF